MENTEKARKSHILIFKLDPESEEFEEFSNEEDLPVYKLLEHDQIVLLVNSEHSRIYIWEGRKVTTKMKFLSAQLAPSIRDHYGIDYTITTIDDGDEPPVFRDFYKLDEADSDEENNN